MGFPENATDGFHVGELKYLYSKEHRMLGLGDYSKLNLQNIGQNGCNLTIAALSMNRSSLTLRLMDSVKECLPDFKGEFLIGDNGSEELEKDIVKKAMEEMPFSCRMVEFDKNYGVAGGRNRLFAEVKTEWILSLDNDLYFVGNPLPKIQKDLWALGCHFMVMPLKDKDCERASLYGGNLYIENMNGVSAGGGTAVVVPKIQMNREYDPFLCTFLAGGISVINKQTFFRCGGFDDHMFVGFEDTEFSVRLYQQGYKVGACGFACVVHDHPKPEKKADTDYEKQRFSRNYLKESAEYFERKHGFSVWNPMVSDWVEKRLSDMGISDGKPAGHAAGSKTKVALVIDKRDWALDHVAAQIVKNLSNEFKFKKIYISEVDNLAQVLLLAEDCQIVHFLWRPLASDFYSDYTQEYIRSLGMNASSFYNRYIVGKSISVAVYDHLMLEESDQDSRFTRLLFSDESSIVTDYAVSSKKLWKIYNERQDILKKPDAILSDGVDLSLFKPADLERFDNIGRRTVRAGWVGNSKWWSVDDLKGLHTVIEPAVKILRDAGYAIELISSDRQERMIPHEQMPDFYRNLDLYLCASLHEGTPNPVLEAMACGVPVISTDVGLVPELFGPEQKKYILESRTVSCLVGTLRSLLNEPEEFKALSQENLLQIQPWDWKIMTEYFRAYFHSCHKNRKAKK